MMKQAVCLFVFLLSVFAMLSSCTRETWSPEETGGGSILFGASTSYSDSPGTRTEYSGLDGSGASVSSGSSVEQIHWLSSDNIRILSAQATSAYGAGVQYADYLVTPKDDPQKGGIAPLTSSGSASDAEGLQWGTTFPHVFYAVYPSPQQSDAVSVSLSGDNAVVSASIPATQTGSWDGDTYKPDMDYAYMWSVASASVKGEVPLPFRPLVTVFEVSLLAEDAAMAAKTLTGVRLSSSASGAALSGSFSATLTPTTAAATPPEVSVADSPAPGTSVEITFPASAGVQLSQTSAKQFTLFALPVDQSQLTLTLTFSDGTNRLLDFKSASLAAGDNPEGWITLPACKKAFAYNLGVDSPPAVVGTFDGLVFAPGDLYLNGGNPTIAETWDGYSPSSTRNQTLFSWEYLWKNVLTAGRTGSSFNTADAATGTIDLPLRGTTYTWRLPTQEEWSSFIGTERAGATVDGVAGRHFASVSLTGSSPFVASGGYSFGMLYFPDNITMSLSFTIEDYDSMMSSSANDITTAQLEEAIGKGCVYLPCAGMMSNIGVNSSIGASGLSWSGSSSDASEAFCYYHDGSNLMTNLRQDKSNHYLSVRLVRDAAPAASPASIPFSASRGQVATRTEYAGYDPESGAGVENINWLASDQVRILSAQASSAYGADFHYADYAVTPGAAEATSATIAPLKSDGTAGGNGLQWGTAFPHVFYALYPSPRQNNTVSIDLSGDGAVLSAEIPAGQDGTMDGSVCKPDMSYAYMYAVKEVNAQETVPLDFQPLVTTLEVTLKASESAADAVLSSKLLTSVSLSSTAGPLSGRFPVTMTSSSVVMPTASDIISGTNSVSLSGFSVALSKTEAKSFTLLMLPLDQTDLTLTLGFLDGTSKSLQLKDSGTPIRIAACRKTYIRNISVPF